jgi:hypothetical protein
MRGGFGRYRYERPQPGLQFHSYEDALYPPRAYRYHIQQTAAPTPTSRSANHSGGWETQATAIVLPTIDADAACGPFLKSSSGGVGSSGVGGSSVSGSASASSLGHLGRSASSAPSNITDGVGVYPMDAERRPPPRLRLFFDCFVPDDDGTDVRSLAEVCRHAEPLNPFHYRELWGGLDGEVATPATGEATHAATAITAVSVKAEPVQEEEGVGGSMNGQASVGASEVRQPEKVAAKAEEKAKSSAATRAATRAAQAALQRTLRALGLTEELSSMVLLAARVPPGGRLTRKQEKLLRLRHQRRPAPPRPIRRGAKVFMPAYAVVARGGRGGGPEAYGLADLEATAATGGLIDVTATGPRVLRVQHATASQRGAFGAVGGGASYGAGLHHQNYHLRGGPETSTTASALVSEFAFDEGDDDERSTRGRGGGRRAGGKRSRNGDDYEGLEDGDIPLIMSGRWSQLGGPGSVGGEATGGLGVGGSGTAAAITATGQLDEEAEEDSDEEDDLSTGMAEDDDDDANFSSDGGNDNDSFGGGGDNGDDDY